MTKKKQINYDFSEKNDWRNSVWNEITSRLTVAPRDAVVLYLAAEQDMDRAEALKRGFSGHNLIAVDREERVIAALRESGKLAIHGDLFDIARAWPESVPVNAVVADFVGGYDEKILHGFQAVWASPAFSHCVICSNFQRGRDAFFMPLKDAMIRTNIKNGFGRPLEDRSFAMCVVFATMTAMCFLKNKKWKSVNEAQAEIFYLSQKLFTQIKYTGGEYKSASGPYFDWAIYNNCLGVLSGGKQEFVRVFGANADTSRRVAAFLAHRTRRLNAA